MKSITAFADGVVILPDFLNTLQLRVAGGGPGDSNNHYAVNGHLDGADIRIWANPTGIANGAAPIKIDGSIDWRDRHVIGFYVNPAATNRGVGQVDDYAQSTVPPVVSLGYTGLGGLTAGGAAPSAGNPPALSAGKYALKVDTTGSGVLLYASTADGSLLIYNASGSTIYPTIILVAFGDTGKR